MHRVVFYICYILGDFMPHIYIYMYVVYVFRNYKTFNVAVRLSDFLYKVFKTTLGAYRKKMANTCFSMHVDFILLKCNEMFQLNEPLDS